MWPDRGPTSSHLGLQRHNTGREHTLWGERSNEQLGSQGPSGGLQNPQWGVSDFCFRFWCWLRASPVRTNFALFRARGGALRAENAHSRAKGDPADGYPGSQDPSGGLRNPNVEAFVSFGVLVLVAGASCLLAAARRASPAPCPNEWINRQKCFVPPLGDHPHTYLRSCPQALRFQTR